MTYKEFQESMVAMELKYQRDQDRIFESIREWGRKLGDQEVDEDEAKDAIDKLYAELEFLKNRNTRKTEQLKMNFARQDAPADIGDIIWASTSKGMKVMKVTEIRLAAFAYPMLKYFGVQLNMKGLPNKVQKVAPQGGIYQTDIYSVNGEPYEYKSRE